MSGSVAISSFLRHEVSFWVCGSAILILSAIVLVNGRALSAKPYPTPEGIPFGITASAILILSAIVFVKGRAHSAILSPGDYRHWRLSYRRLSSLESIVLIVLASFRKGTG